MIRRLPLLLTLGALSAVADAAIIINGNPSTLRGGATASTLQVKGWVSAIKLSGRHGRQQVVHLPRPYGLHEALPLPAGDWTDLTLVLDGPLSISTDGGAPVTLDVAELTVPLDDPAARSVKLEWTLPEGVLGALAIDAASPTLATALEDGALATAIR